MSLAISLPNNDRQDRPGATLGDAPVRSANLAATHPRAMFFSSAVGHDHCALAGSDGSCGDRFFNPWNHFLQDLLEAGGGLESQ